MTARDSRRSRRTGSTAAECTVAAVETVLPLLMALLGHGAAPSALAVLHADEAGPTWVYVSRGLAHRRADGRYDYISPAYWGGVETPLAAAFDPDSVVVFADGGVFATADGGCEFERVASADLVAVAAGEGGVWLLSLDGGLAWWDGEEVQDRPRASETGVDSLWPAGSQVWVAGARPDPILVPPGGPPRALSVPSEHPLQRAVLRGVFGDRVDLTGPTLDGIHLWRSDDAGASWERILDGETSLHGPAELCGGRVAVMDGALTPLPGEPPGCDLGHWLGRRLTCLGSSGGVSYTCELRQLRGLEDDTLLFSLEQMVGPAPGCPADAGTRAVAELDWIDLAADAGLDRVPSSGEGEGEGEGEVDGGLEGTPEGEGAQGAEAATGPPDDGLTTSGGGCDCGTIGWRQPWPLRR